MAVKDAPSEAASSTTKATVYPLTAAAGIPETMFCT